MPTFELLAISLRWWRARSRGVPHSVYIGAACKHLLHQPVQRGDVAFDETLELKSLPLAEDRNAVIAYSAAHDNAVSRPCIAYRNSNVRLYGAHARCVYE